MVHSESREPECAVQALRNQSKDCQMEEAGDGFRSADRPERNQVLGSRTKQSLSLSASIHCCRLMIAFTPFKPQFRVRRVHLCIAVCNANGSSRLPELDATSRNEASSGIILSPFSISTSRRSEQKKANSIFVAIDHTSKFAFIELHEKATTRVDGDFLNHLVAAVPYKVHTVLTDNGIHFTTPVAGGSAVFEIKEAMAMPTPSSLPVPKMISIIG